MNRMPTPQPMDPLMAEQVRQARAALTLAERDLRDDLDALEQRRTALQRSEAMVATRRLAVQAAKRNLEAVQAYPTAAEAAAVLGVQP